MKGSPEYKHVLQSQKRKYSDTQGSQEHVNKKARMRLNYNEKKSKTCVEKFKEKLNDGPFYVCVCCNRGLYSQMVRTFCENSYPNDIENLYFAHVDNVDDAKEYICRTCHVNLMKHNCPGQAVANILEIFDVPEQFKDFRRLEKVLVAQRLLFKKVVTMPRGEFKKIRGTICNVPLDSADVVTKLPRGFQ